jgi:hypothetical protein
MILLAVASLFAFAYGATTIFNVFKDAAQTKVQAELKKANNAR